MMSMLKVLVSAILTLVINQNKIDYVNNCTLNDGHDNVYYEGEFYHIDYHYSYKYLRDIREYAERKRRQKEWQEFLGALSNLFKVVDERGKEGEESQ